MAEKKSWKAPFAKKEEPSQVTEKVASPGDTTLKEIQAKLKQSPMLILRRGDKPGQVLVTSPKSKDIEDINKLLAGEEL